MAYRLPLPENDSAGDGLTYRSPCGTVTVSGLDQDEYDNLNRPGTVTDDYWSTEPLVNANEGLPDGVRPNRKQRRAANAEHRKMVRQITTLQRRMKRYPTLRGQVTTT